MADAVLRFVGEAALAIGGGVVIVIVLRAAIEVVKLVWPED